MAATLNKRWSWDLNIQKSSSGESGVKVVVWDSDSSTILISTSTDSNGDISTQTITEVVYTVTSSTTTSNTKTPHVLSFVKYGLTTRSLNLNFNSTRNDTVYMTDDSYITETTKATVAAYTGITINHTSDTITVSSSKSIYNLYDYTQNESYDSPQKDYPGGCFTTVDGNNFKSEYDLSFSGGTFSGNDKTILVSSLTLNGGEIKDLVINGDVTISSTSVTSFSDIDVTGSITFSVSGTFTLNSCEKIFLEHLDLGDYVLIINVPYKL